MKIGVIADIHSNLLAFKACMDYLEQERCEEYIFLGDYVSDIPYTRETMDYLYQVIKRHKCHLLRGNREDYMLEQRRVLREEKDYAKKWIPGSGSGNLLFAYEQLTEEDLDFFEQLPISFRYEREGYPSIACAHGSVESNRKLLQLEDPDTKEYLLALEEDYLLAGHTHIQGAIEYRGKTYINTGSCGIAIGVSGLAHCAILEGQQSWNYRLLEIPYDKDQIIKDYFSSGLFDIAPWFTSSNIHNLRTGIDRTAKMVERAKELQEIADRTRQWPDIGEEFFEQAARELQIPYGKPC